jgi:hypothetical protein
MYRQPSDPQPGPQLRHDVKRWFLRAAECGVVPFQHHIVLPPVDDIIYDIDNDMTYDIIGQCSIRSAPAFGRPRCGCGLAATLPRLCRPDPALAESLGPDPLRLGDYDRHHTEAAPAVAPHPDVHLVDPATVDSAPLRVG